MGDESKIPDFERGLDQMEHDEFMPSPTEKQIVEDEEEAYFLYIQFEWKKVSLK